MLDTSSLQRSVGKQRAKLPQMGLVCHDSRYVAVTGKVRRRADGAVSCARIDAYCRHRLLASSAVGMVYSFRSSLLFRDLLGLRSTLL